MDSRRSSPVVARGVDRLARRGDAPRVATRRARSFSTWRLGHASWERIGAGGAVATLVLLGCGDATSARREASSVAASAPEVATTRSSLLEDASALEKACREDLAGRAILRIQILATKAMIESIAPDEDVADIHLFRDGGLTDQGKSTLKRGAPAIDLSRMKFTDLPRMRRETAAASGAKEAGPITIEPSGITVVAADRGVGRFDLGGNDFRWEPE